MHVRADRAPLLVGLVSAAYSAALLVLSPGQQPSADSHFHFEVARWIARGDFVPDLARGLPMTILRDMPVDHYWGYHLLLAPFALLPDAELGMKVATVMFFAAVAVSMCAFLRARGVAYPWAWALAAMLFSTQDWRYMQLRGGQLVVPLLFAMLHVAFFEPRAWRRRAWLLGIGYVALLGYNGGIVLLPFHAAATLALVLLKPKALEPGQVLEPAITALGAALGLTLNPYMDGRASPWRFFALHVGQMGRDSAHLYDDLDIAEFHGFPAKVLAIHPEWLVLLAATIAAVVIVARRRQEASTESIVLAGAAIAGIVMTAQAMRVREYSVPLAFSLLAVLATRVREVATGAIAAAILAVALVVHGRTTLPLILVHLPTAEYRGARALLEDNGDRPLLNIAEADCQMLRWEDDRVVCVQALSRYFIYPYKDLFHDVWELHEHADTSPETGAILGRFVDRGVRLVAAHKTSPVARFAGAHPEVLRTVFVSAANGARIYVIEGAPGGAQPPSGR